MYTVGREHSKIRPWVQSGLPPVFVNEAYWNTSYAHLCVVYSHFCPKTAELSTIGSALTWCMSLKITMHASSCNKIHRVYGKNDAGDNTQKLGQGLIKNR